MLISNRSLPITGLSNFRVDEIEIVLPVRAVSGAFPASADRPLVWTELAGEALREVERREVGGVTKQRPDAVAEGHRIDASDSARIEVVLRVRPVGVGADDRDAVRGAGNLRSLDQ